LDPKCEAELLLEIARLYAALIRVIRDIDDPKLKAELADLIWPPAPSPPKETMPLTRPILTATFWADTAERAVKTAAQTVVLGLGLSDTGFGNAFEYDWALAAGFAVGGAVLSVLTSIASAPFGVGGTASLLPVPPGPVASDQTPP